MKSLFLSLCTLAICFSGWAQEHDPGHDSGHDPRLETPGALISEMAQAIASQPGERVLDSHVGVVPRFALATQKSLFAEVGVSLDIYRIGYTAGSEYVSFGYSNLRPYISGEIMAAGHLLGGAKAGIEYIRATPLIGMALGGDVSYLTDGPRRAVLLTPRLMLSLGTVELFYGYNFFLRNELVRWVGHHRLGVSITLDRRFWRRKRQMYEDYYNTYL
ncbi:MAG: hypothetical protein LBU97_03640 [Alistipes sp.]|jgi:hypothetical protein|nr:hypothetical protein [Alistipes sp.]